MGIHEHIETLLDEKHDRLKLASQLGFFSKPLRIKDDKEEEYVVKLYKPLRNEKTTRFIIDNHDAYIREMIKTGIRIPDTEILLKKRGKRFVLVIVQKAFEEDELVRGLMEKAGKEEVLYLLKLLLDDTLVFWKNKPAHLSIGFHPTLRNYAIRNNRELHYFDTFPPMLMEQQQLNKLILQMAPVKMNVKNLLPSKLINRVSDEYFYIDKMLTGIVGSTCRLRPELYTEVLDFARDYIQTNTLLDPEEKNRICLMLEKPPQLSGLWVSMRKMFGKTGKPNIKKT